MQARLYDGRTAAAQAVTLSLDGGGLRILGDAVDWTWPLDAVREERAVGGLRLSGPEPDARLLVEAAPWRALTGVAAGAAGRERTRRAEVRLVAGLAAAGLSVAALVFWGVPAASGPLARATPIEFERRIGENIEAQVRLALKPCEGDPAGAVALGQLGGLIGRGADSRFNVQVEAVRAPFVNALALPGGTVLVTDELIAVAATPDELAAVVAHEIAHVEQRHVMQAVWRAFGAGLFLDLTVGGGSGAGQQAVLLAGSFADLSFSREAETEADARGMALLQRAGLSSQGMAGFFGRLAGRGSSPAARNAAEWLSSHPDTARRVERARATGRPGAPALNAADWAAVRRACDTEADD